MKKWLLLVFLFLFVSCTTTSNRQSETVNLPTVLVNLSIEGADYQTLKLFKKRLEKLPGVKKVYQKSFSVRGKSHLEVDYQGISQSLADAIQDLSSSEIPIEVLECDPAHIVIRISRSPSD